jgi:hypothetical protein
MTSIVAGTPAAPAVPAPAAAERDPVAPARPASLWGNRDFPKFWSSEALSLFGTQIATLAIPLTAVLVFQARPAQVGLLRFLQLVPYLGLAMVFGVWVDRARRKRVMMLANGARMVLIAAVPILSATHRLTLALLLAIACAVGVFSASGAAGLRSGLLAGAVGSAAMVLPVLLSPVSRLLAMPVSER